MTSNVRVRIAPSPTGPFHVGTARTALFNYLFARKNHGVMVLRMENTDEARSTPEYEKDIMEGFTRLGLAWGEGPDIGGEYGPYRQSERTDIYIQYLDALLSSGDAYQCYCTAEELEATRVEQQARKQAPRYSKRCRTLSGSERRALEQDGRPHVIRFKVPEGRKISFRDAIRAKQSEDTDNIGDFIIARSGNVPLYNFAVVVDDITMRITHVIRGEDLLPNTARQILMYEALHAEPPVFAHIPLILNPDKTKLSKRKNPVSVSDYLGQGYLPEALINFLALLGWNPGTDREIFSLDELVKEFSLEKVQKGGAVFNIGKLDWMNGEYIRAMTPQLLLERVKPYWSSTLRGDARDDYLIKIVTVLRERLERLAQIDELTEYFFREQEYGADLLTGKNMTQQQTKRSLELAITGLRHLDSFEKHATEKLLTETVEAEGIKKGELLWPIRAALSGRDFSPGTFELLWVFGKEEALKRLEKAVQKL